VATEHAAFYGAAPARADAATNAALSHAVGQLYMRRWFPAAGQGRRRGHGPLI